MQPLRRSRVGTAVLPWLLPVALLLLWEVSLRAGWISPFVLPWPAKVWDGARGLITSGALQENLTASAWRATVGFMIGASSGFVLAILTGLSPLWANILNPTLQSLRSIPSLGILPVLILIFGFGETTKLTIIALGSFVPLYLNAFAGIRLTDPRLLELGRTQRLSRWQILRDIVIPGAMPSIFTGLRFSLGVAWITLIVAESFSVEPGIGYMARHARERNLTEIVVLSMLIYAVLGKLTDMIVRALEAYTLPWHTSLRQTKNAGRT